MFILSFLNDRQIGGVRKETNFSTNRNINFDDQLSRLVNCSKDVYPTCVQSFGVPPFACKFRKDKELDLLAVANEDGELLLINTESSKVVNSFMAHHNAIFDICWLPDKYQLITASGDHRANLFDMNTSKRISSYAGHLDSVKSVSLCPTDNAMFATGSKDGNINVWDRREKSGEMNDKPSITINAAHSRKINKHANDRRRYLQPCRAMSSVSAVVFQNSNHLVSSGVADGTIKIWDLRKTFISNRTYSPSYQIKYCDERFTGHGCSSLVFDSLYKKLYACTTSNTIYQLDCHSYTNNHVMYTGFTCKTYFVKLALSCDDQYLLCGSSNHKAYIWKTTKPGKPLLALPGHSAEVTSVEWSPYNITKLVTCGDDCKVLAWSPQESDDTHGSHENVSADVEDADVSDSDYSQIIVPGSHRNSSDYSKTPKTSIVRSIRNFFSPIMSSSLELVSLGQSSNSESSLHSQSASNEPAVPVVSPQSRSPCKALNENGVVLVQNEGAVASAKTNISGKENSTSPGTSVESCDKRSAQLKRKSDSQESLLICKYHPRGCGRTRGHTRCGKKIKILPAKHNIKTYFSVSPPE